MVRLWYATRKRQNSVVNAWYVCFSKNKRSLFEEKQNTITPVKISKYLIGPNFKGAGQEIRVNDMSVVQTPSSSEYNFQYKPDSDNSPVPLKDIDGDAYEDGVRLSIKGKITKGANVEVVGYKRLKMFTNLSYDANFVVKSLKVL